MSYQALYRAFRPERFADVVGQEPITTTLVNQILTGRVAHAYLFCGSRGTGKTSTAKVFARAINCQRPGEGAEPCGACQSCQALQRENSMDVIEIDAASNNGVDEIRELRDKIKYPPVSCQYKVYIIDEVHMLSSGAFNALLKTLEEPPSHAVFILCTTEPQKLPATILSRCQRFDFKRIPARVIIDLLKRVLAAIGREAEGAALDEIARASEGGMRDALSLMDMCLAYGDGTLNAALVRDVLGASDRGSLFEFAGALIAGDAGTAIRVIDRQMNAGRDAQVFSREAASHLRALMIAQFAGDDLPDLLEITDEDAARYREQAKGVASEKLMRAMELFITAESEMRWASSPRSVLELCAVRACHPEREAGYEALAERVARLEAGGISRPVVAAAAPSVPPMPDAPYGDDAPWDAPPPPETMDPAPAPHMPEAPKPGSAAKPAIAKPAASAAGNVEGADLWAKVVEGLRKAQPALYTPVSYLIFQGVEGDLARLAMPKKWKMFYGVLNQDAKRQLIEQQLSEVFSRPMRAQLSEEGDAPRSAPAAASAPAGASTAPKPSNPLDQIYDLFGRENVSVLDEE